MNRFLKGLLSALIVCTLVFSIAASAFSEEFKTIEKGSRGEDVKALQQALIVYGYLSGSADGDYGDMTAKAVSAFQTANGLPATGVADEETLQLLYEMEAERRENAVLQKGDNNADVLPVEQRLIELGYLFGAADNKFDENTEAAVKAFQNSNGFETTGMLDKDLRAALFSDDVIMASRAVFVVPERVKIITRSSSPYLDVIFRNNSNETVDAVDFRFKVYNSYGERCKVYDRLSSNRNEEERTTYQFSGKIAPGSSAEMSRKQQASLSSFRSNSGESIILAKVAVSRYHTVEGNTYDIPEQEWIWVDTERNVEYAEQLHALPAGEVTPELKSRVEQLNLGIEKTETVADYLAEIYHLPSGGLYINEYPNKGLLKDAGITYGDVITEVDGYAVYTMNDLVFATGEGSKDGSLDITFYHEGQENQVAYDTKLFVSAETEPAAPNNEPAIQEESNTITTEIDKISIYLNALHLYLDENYAEARKEFEKLGDYERSKELLLKCEEQLRLTADEVVLPSSDEISSENAADLAALCKAVAAEYERRHSFDSFNVPVGTWTVGKNLNSGLYSVQLMNGKDYGYFTFVLSQYGNSKVLASTESKQGPFSHIWLNDGDTVEITADTVTFAPGIFGAVFEDADQGTASLDLSMYDDKALTELYHELILQLGQEPVSSITVPGGVWKVGEDIPAGTYDVSAVLNDSHGNFSFSVYSSSSWKSTFGDVLSVHGYGNEEKTAMNIELKDGYVLIASDCTATLTESNENVFFG